MNAFDTAILVALANLSRIQGKQYAIISQEKLLQILSKIYQVQRKRRALNYRLRKLEQAGLITRIRRISRDKHGRLQAKPTLYQITRQGWKLIRKHLRLSIIAARRVMGSIKKYFVKDLISALNRSVPKAERGKAYFHLIQAILNTS